MAIIKKVTVDFETQSDINLKKCGAYEYSMSKETIVLCMAFKANWSDKCNLFAITQINKHWNYQSASFQDLWRGWILNPEVVFTAHNAFFEQCIYNNVLVRRCGWPSIPINKWRCTAAKAAACAIPRNLADAGLVMRLSTQKDLEGHKVMMKLCKPTSAWKAWNDANKELAAGRRIGPKKRAIAERSEPSKYWTPTSAPDDFATLYRYCKIDVLAEEKLDESLPDLTNQEQKLWVVDQKINLRGIAVDIPLVNKISSIMAAESKVMVKELDILTMGLVSSGNARAAILDFLTLEGIEMPNLRAKTVDEFLSNGKVTGDAKIILEIRRALAKSSTAKYQTFQRRAATDGRVRDLLLYCGAARTGRWGGVGIQPQNFPRGIIKDIFEAIERIKNCSVEDLKMLYGENLMPLFSSVLRGMFVSSPGYDLFVEDYNAIECRVLWWLAGHEKGLQKFRDGVDPYKIRAAAIYKKSVLEITDDERQVGKAAELGCGYQMGNKKFVTSAWDVYRAKVTSDIAKVAVTSYRDDNWPVVEMWEHYQEAAILATENPGNVYKVRLVKFVREKRWLFIILPSGRRLAYADPKVIWAPVYKLTKKGEDERFAGNPNALKIALELGFKVESKFQTKRLTYWEVNQMARKADCVIPKWSLENTYGGKIVENVVQAVSRDLLAEAIVRADKAGFNVLMHSHDELVSEAPAGKFKRDDFKNIMEVLPTWAMGLPLKSGGWVGDRYKKG